MAIPSPAVISASSTATTSGQITCALTHDSATLWYCTGFEITYGGATAGSVVNATLAGLLGGTLNFSFAVPTGVTLGGSFTAQFNTALSGVDTATDLVLTVPAIGAGNTRVSANLHGFKAGNRNVM